MNTNFISSLSHDFLQQFPLTEQNTILCSYSGGSDSTFLLHFLCQLREEIGFNLRAFYLNHNLRGKESIEEEKLVFSTISRLSVPTVFYSKDIALLAEEQKVSTELCGRNIRREIIQNLVKIFGLDYVCTGHHRDDRVETYLFNTFRGTGLRGLTTLKETNGKVLRPLLSLSKSDITTYLEKESIPFCEDSTNHQSEYRRNRIRNILIPAIKEQINPELEKAICRNIAVLEEYETTVNKLVTIFLERYVEEIGNYVYISNEMQKDALFTPLLLKEVFRTVLQENSSAECDLSFINFEQVLDSFLREKKKTIQLSISGEVNTFFSQENMVLIFKNDFERLLHYSLTFSSQYSEIEEAYFTLSLKPCRIKPKRVFSLVFPIIIRGRNAGDYVYLEGLESKKKVKEILINRKILTYEKVFHPIIEFPNGDCFLAGIGMKTFAFQANSELYSFHYVRKR